MKKPIFCIAGDTIALRHAANQLAHWGYEIAHSVSQGVTHLLLPVPSLETAGTLKGGQSLEDVLSKLPSEAIVLGGNLPPLPFTTVDFLKDEYYLRENASITARCAFTRLQQSWGDFTGARVMVIGWGRIGKQLAPLLHVAGAAVTVAARREADLQAAVSKGYDTVVTGDWEPRKYHIIVNTAPAPLLDQSDARHDALLMDLASVRGISGDRVIWARGLPNQDAPEESGMLIAKTALRFALGKELL